MAPTRILAAGAFAWLASGCGSGSDAAPPGGDTGTQPDAGEAADPNGTFERAEALVVGEFPGNIDGVEGYEDADYFKFEGRAGEWVTIRASRTSEKTIIVGDASLVLYDANRQPLAFNASVRSLVGENVLSRIVTRLPADGTYYVLVADVHAPSIYDGVIQPYRISVVELPGAPGYTVEADESPDPTPSPLGFQSWTLPTDTVLETFALGGFSGPDDVDAFGFEVASSGGTFLSARVEAAATNGNGSTTPAGRLWVTDESGTRVLARIDNSSGQDTMSPPLPAGRYVLWVAHPDAPSGANDFYVVRTMLATDNPSESEDETNGAVGGAEVLPINLIESGGARVSSYFTAHVGDGDVDYFRFDSEPDRTVSVFCTSQEFGSGLVSLQVEARDALDATLAQGTESGEGGVSLDGIAMPATGALYLRLSKSSQLADVEGDWVRCIVSAL